MKLFNKVLPVLLAGAALVSSCKKDKEFEPIGDAGRTIVKVINGGSFEEPGHPLTGVNFTTGDQTVVVADIRRDVPNSAELNSPLTVTVKVDTAMMRIWNDSLAAHGQQTYSTMPEAWFSSIPDFTWGGTFDLTFAPGEFAKAITVTIPNATLMNPSNVYGFPFTITSTNPDDKLVSYTSSIITLIGAKNIYDGIYAVTCGTVTRYTNPTTVEPGSTLNGPLAGNPDVYLITTGATQVGIPPAGQVGGLFWTVGSNSMVAGVDGIRLTVDPVTNLVTATSSGNATFGNWAGHLNKYDPATKTFNLAFRWNPTANVREYEICLKYKGPR